MKIVYFIWYFIVIIRGKWNYCKYCKIYYYKKMKLHVYFFLFGYHICLFAAFDFLSQVPLHRIPHCDIVRSMIIIKISSWYKTFNSFTVFFIVLTNCVCSIWTQSKYCKFFYRNKKQNKTKNMVCIYCNGHLFVTSVWFCKQNNYQYLFLH